MNSYEMGREKPVVSSELTRFTDWVVSFAQKAVVIGPDPVVKKGDGDYAVEGIATIHGLREYLDHTYRRLRLCAQADPRNAHLARLATAVGGVARHWNIGKPIQTAWAG